MSITLSHSGLPKGVTRNDVITLVPIAGELVFGFSEKTIRLLKRYVYRTFDEDYLPGQICGMWEQPHETAQILKISTRALSYKEEELEKAGLILRTATAHARRTGKREGGGIKYVAGINLGPLIERYSELMEMLEFQQRQDDSLPFLRLQISELRDKIRNSGEPELIELADHLSSGGRTKRITNVGRLEAIKADLDLIVVRLPLLSGAKFTSDRSEPRFSPNIPRKETTKGNTRRAASDWTGNELSTITPAAAIRLASLDFRTTLELIGEPTWPNILEAAYKTCSQLGITEWVWGQACSKLGPMQTALCVLAIDRNHKLPSDHPFYCNRPSGALFKMSRKAPTQFNLYGLLKAIEGYPEVPGGNVVAMPQPAVQWHEKGFHEMGKLVPDIVARLQIDNAESARG